MEDGHPSSRAADGSKALRDPAQASRQTDGSFLASAFPIPKIESSWQNLPVAQEVLHMRTKIRCR